MPLALRFGAALAYLDVSGSPHGIKVCDQDP